MGLVNLKANQVIHKKGDKVETLEIVVKGKVSAAGEEHSIIIEVGGIIGSVEHPGQEYGYTFTAVEDSAVYSYPYNSREDLEKVVSANPKIAPILASQMIRNIIASLDRFKQDYKDLVDEYNKVLDDAMTYPMLAVQTGNEVKDFPEIDELEEPKMVFALSSWQEDFYRGLLAEEDKMKKYVYSSSIAVANGIVLYGIEALSYISACRDHLAECKKEFRKKTARFVSELRLIRAKSDDLKRNGHEGAPTDIDIKDALNTILQYAAADEQSTNSFREAVLEFKKYPARYDTSEESRLLRRKVCLDFYTISTAAF